MKAGFALERMRAGAPGDRGILVAIAVLTGTGIAALWSASSDYALSLGKSAGYFAARQAIYLLPAGLVFALCATVDLDSIRKRTGLITLATLLVLLLPFVPGLGENRNGATRWIDLGVTTFQPSELWKLATVLYLAHILDKKADRISESPGVLIPPFLLVALGCIVVYLQTDFSTAVVIGVAAAAVFWASGAPVSFFLGLGAAAAPLAALSVLTSDFRLRRILTFMFPAYEPHGQGYQVLGSIRAIRSGGLVGKGLGLGTLKQGSIPEVHSDFVFSAWTEETGLVGVLVVLALWAFIAWRGFKVALGETDRYRSSLVCGLTFLLCIEVLVNLGVVSGAVPATGMALPFFSAGGSSLLSTAVACGLIYNASRSPANARARGPNALAAGEVGDV
ncbi:MAG TPA: putative lipid II flippase FtsW [Rectinemataceae bacterium]|nr:putative lipid II flippase FtsW [Rectinemataceae bacterium]